MRKLIAGVIIGCLCGVTIQQLASFAVDKLFPAPSIYMAGTIKYAPSAPVSESGAYPEGYYIEEKTRVYLDTIDLQLLGQETFVRRPVTGAICGPDAAPCFARIKVLEARASQQR
jgi:hypothetical protein